MATQDFINLLESNLRQIISPSTEGIKAASTRLENEIYTNPDAVPALIHILQKHPEPQMRQLAGVEASKQASRSWEDKVSPAVKQEIHKSLLESTFGEENSLVRHTSSRVISNIAKVDLENNQWPELTSILFQAAQSNSAAHREVAVYIIYTLMDTGDDIWENPLELIKLLSSTLNDPESKQLRVSSVLALGKVAENIDSTTYERSASQSNPVVLFRALIPQMVEVLKQTISDDDEKNASQIFEVFNNLVCYCDTALISQHFGDLIKLFTEQIASEPSLSEEYRGPAIQFLFAALRFKKSKFKQLKVGAYITEHMIKIAAEPFDEEDDEDEQDETRPGTKALRLLDSLSTTLPPSQVMIPLLHFFPQLVTSSDKFQRYAGFSALSVAVEGAPDTVSKNLSDILPHIIKGLQDSEVLVQKGALLALCQMATELHSEVGAEHEVLLPLVFNIIDNANSVKMAKAACVALDAILETIDSQIITEKYLPVLIPRLIHLFGYTDDLSVKGSIANAIASAAFSAGKNYLPYFEQTITTFEPFVSASASNAEEMTDEQTTLCSTILDSMGTMAGAVGKQAFSPYVEPIAKTVLACLKSSKGRLRESGFILVGILARMYGEDFAGFLEPALEQIWVCLKQEEFGGVEDDEDDEDLDQVGLDDEEITAKLMEKFSVNSGVAVEKEVALETLSEIIVGTKGSFAPYLQTAIKETTQLTDHFYDGIKKAALVVLWKAFITFYKIANLPKWGKEFPSTQHVPDVVAQLAETARTASLEALANEEEISTAIEIFNLYGEAFQVSGSYIIGSVEQLEAFCSEVILVISKEHCCQVMDEDFDEELEAMKQQGGIQEDQESAEYDTILIDSAFDALINLSKAMGRKFIPVLSSTMPVIEKYCSNKKNESERATGVGSLAEILGGLGTDLSSFVEKVLPIFLHGLDDKDLGVRSNAAFGIGILCANCDEESALTVLKDNYLVILSKLQGLLKKVDKSQRKASKKANKKELETDADLAAAANETNLRGIANACGCVARMALKHPDWIPIGEVVPVLIGLLPIYEGFEENEPIFELITRLYQEDSPIVVSLTPQVVGVLEEMFVMQKEAEVAAKTKSFEDFETDQSSDYYNRKPFQHESDVVNAKKLLQHIEGQNPGLVSGNAVLTAALSE